PVGSLADQAGLRAGDLVRAASHDGGEWHDVRSMSDLSWEMMQALSQGVPLQLRVSSGESRGERNVVLPLERLDSREIDGPTLNRIGLDGSYSEAIVDKAIPGGAAAKAGILPGDRVLSIDGQTIADRSRLIQVIRGSAENGDPSTMLWRVERAGQVVEVQVTPV